jgi:hypothetical protein
MQLRDRLRAELSHEEQTFLANLPDKIIDSGWVPEEMVPSDVWMSLQVKLTARVHWSGSKQYLVISGRAKQFAMQASLRKLLNNPTLRLAASI